MIIVRLKGGLGNQMFQYALGKNLAVRNDTDLKLDLSYYEGDCGNATRRKYELHHFNINAKSAKRLESAELSGQPRSPFETFLVKLRRLLGLAVGPACFIKQERYNYDPQILTLPDNVYLEGYWQAEGYIQPVAEEIKKDFALKEPLSGKNLAIAQKITSSQSVSIHVRRGDYVTNPETSQHHGFCGTGYYREAMQQLSSSLSNPHFFFFSDDMPWVKENLYTDKPVTFVDHNDEDNCCEDLRLMSLCNHNIIANSSFSWWGAWLNNNPHKIVIAPSRWFNDESRSAEDLIPHGWLRI